MSGHSKWATTKRAKAVTDAARSRVFTKLTRLITMAARQGGGEPENNPTLRMAIDKAREANVPRDNIDRAIARGTGEGGEAVESFSFEVVGPAGTALIVEGVTDNKNRTTSEVKNLVHTHGAKVAEPGSQRWQFERVGVLVVSGATANDAIELAAIEANARDTQVTENGVEVLTEPSDLTKVRDALASKKFAVSGGEFALLPKNPVEVSEADRGKLEKLSEALLERDDVQNVWSNIS